MKKYYLLFVLMAIALTFKVNAQCTGTGTEAQGTATFNIGYTYSFSTSGTDVTVTFELLDTDKDTGLVGFLQEEGESEGQVTFNRIATKTFTGQTDGVSKAYSCRWAYAGGSIETAFIPYIVGDDCQAVDPAKDASLSDLQIDAASVSGFDPKILQYEVILAASTTVVPTVTATTTEAAATVSITPASTLPGTSTVLVTSSDVTETETYTINFELDAPLIAAPTPLSRDLGDVLSVFSDSYTGTSADVSVANFNPDWGQATVATTETIAGNSTLKYVDFNYQGIAFGTDEAPNNQDLTGMTHMHVDVWTNASAVGVSLISATTGEKRVDLAISEYEWVSYDILLSEFTVSGLTLTDIKEIKFDQGEGAPTVFVDNIFFYSSEIASSPVALSPYCNTEVRHFGSTTGEAGSAVYLTVTNIDATSMSFTIESVDGDPVDFLEIQGSGSSSSSTDNSVTGVITSTRVWNTAPDDVTFTMLWSKESTAGNWQLSDVVVPFLAKCTYDDLTISATETSTDDVTCGNLTVDASAIYTIDEGHTLTILGDLTVNGSLVINSGASLITYDGGTLGNVTVKRNTRYSDGKYSFVGIPVENDGSIEGSDLGSISYSYNETVAYGGDGLLRWENAATTELETGVGYAQAFQQEISFTGVPNDGTITVSGLSHTAPDDNHDEHGWSLLSNPYPAAINVEKFLMDATNSTILDGSIYLWDDNGSETERGDNSDYLTVNAVGEVGGPNGGVFNGYLGSMQGFFVKVASPDADVSVNFTESMRVGGVNKDATFFRAVRDDSPSVKLAIESKNQGFYNELLVGLRSDASVGIDKHYDATKLIFDTDLQFYSLIEDSKFAIQGLPIESGVATELAFNLKESAELTLSVKEMITSSDEYFYLYDKVTGLTYDLNETESITFSASKGSDQNRFTLTYGVKEVLSNSTFVNKPVYRFINNELIVSFNEATHVSGYAVYDLAGKTLLSNSLNNSLSELIIPINAKGINIVRIITTEGSFTRKFLF